MGDGATGWRDAPSTPDRRGAGRLLLDPVFGPYLAGKTLSLVGLWLHNLVAVVVGYQITGSVTFVGVLSLVQFGPQILLAGWSGSLADRSDRVLQIMIGRVLTLVASAALGLWCLGGTDRPGSVIVLLATSLVMGVGLIVGGPAMMTLVPDLVRPPEVPAAVRLDALPMLIGRTFGPALGGLLMTTVGAGPTFLAGAGMNLAFLTVLMVIRPRRDAVRVTDSTDSSMGAALFFLRKRPRLAVLLTGVTAASYGADPSITLAPAIAERGGLGAGAVGIYSAAFGAGAAVAVMVMGPLARRVGTPRLITGALALLILANAGLALPLSLASAVVAFTCAGAGMSVALTGCTTLLQLAVPDEFRGRIMSLWLVGFVGSRPIAALVNGVLADLISVAAALGFVALVNLAALMFCLPRRTAPPGYTGPPARETRPRT